MRRIPRKLSIFLVLTLSLALILTGCSGSGKTLGATKSNSPESSNGTGSTSTNEFSTSGLKPYNIDWYYDGEGPLPDEEKIEEALNDYFKDKLNITVDLHPYDWGTYDERMQALIATGEKMDLVFTCTWAFDYIYNASKGAFVDITDMLEDNAPHIKQVLDGVFLEGSKINGRNYGIPCNKEKGMAPGIMYFQKYVDKYNIDINSVNALEDLEPIMEMLKQNEPEIIGIVVDTGPSHLPLDYLIGREVPIVLDVDGEKEFINLTNHESYVKMLHTMEKYYKKGYVKPDAATAQDTESDYQTGNVFCGVRGFSPGQDIDYSLLYGSTVKMKKLKGSAISRNEDIMGSMMAIAATSENPERVLQFYDYFYHDPYVINLMDFGIEGEHYVKNPDGTIKFAEGTDDGANSGWNPGTPWMIGDQTLSYLFEGDSPTRWEDLKAFNEQCKLSPSCGFVFDAEPVRNEIAAIKNVYKAFAWGLETGTLETDKNLPLYKEKLEAAGINTIVEEGNRQYKEWLEKSK